MAAYSSKKKKIRNENRRENTKRSIKIRKQRTKECKKKNDTQKKRRYKKPLKPEAIRRWEERSIAEGNRVRVTTNKLKIKH